MKTKFHIFKVVANHLSFTKAAEELFISQPAVSKTIRSLEDSYYCTFFLRNKNSIELTRDGAIFLTYVDRILSIHAELDNEFSDLKENLPKEICFGVSTTLVNNIMPKIIVKFRTQYPDVNFNIKSGNSEGIENLILNQQLNYGITEGRNTHKKLQFKKFIKDEIVLVTNVNNSILKSDTIDKKTLQEIPMVERELGSGTRKIIYQFLNAYGIEKLNTVVTLNSVEAIKNYLNYSNDFALISINAVREDLINNRLKIIEIEDLTIERWFYFVSRTGYQSKVMEYFEKFSQNNL
ncbi:LysR substrate-binding domain-containing protein [Wenyingzhuangia sp. 2_MG-2023]|uniref:LysR substrate-binding domain-containing protein n=1 Tax=Wenyingzhuangia sp. 2_MG-2023 TaxID=3062639 RepID=UPI0026E42683|nr:LysR substrate-binding domain-containing protein [Wenyingzhuangia sp. 2_MG-2023]MDO6738902.1 LysR substrate-binding domain-containing protein [Wenyingzhuangia sp. 2_MG-2023]